MTSDHSAPSLRLAYIFETAVAAGSLSETASRVGISQPAVTQSLTRLERLVGAALLHRGSHGCQPTALGEILAGRVGRMFGFFEQALAQPHVGSPFAEPERIPFLARSITEAQIIALSAIHRQGAIERAALSLGYSTPSVHRAVRGLEVMLRRPLLAKSAFGMVTTRAGAELARMLQLGLKERDDGLDELALAQGIHAARLAIGVLPMACMPVLAEALSAVSAQYPGSQVSVSEGVYQDLETSLRSGQIDLIYGVLRPESRMPDIEGVPLFLDPHVLVANSRHKLLRRDQTTVEDLAECQWIAPPITSPRRHQIEAILSRAGASPRIAVETNSLVTLKALLVCSDFVTLLPRYEAEQEVATGSLAILAFADGLERQHTGLAMRRDWKPTPIQQSFMNGARCSADARFGVAQ